MTRLEFAAECGIRLVDWGVALESPIVQAALLDRDDDAVRRALDEEF